MDWEDRMLVEEAEYMWDWEDRMMETDWKDRMMVEEEYMWDGRIGWWKE